jgi:hypothetical protein
MISKQLFLRSDCGWYSAIGNKRWPAAVSVLDRIGESVCFLFTDVKLAGRMSCAALAAKAKEQFPQMDVVVTSSSLPPELPGDAKAA